MDRNAESDTVGPTAIDEVKLKAPASFRRSVSMPEIELRTESNSVAPGTAELEADDCSNRSALQETYLCYSKNPILVPQHKPKKKKLGKLMSLIQIFYDLDYHYLKASEGAHEACKLMDATTLRHDSPLANDQGHSNPLKLVTRAVTWNASKLKDNLTHASLLDGILAWEKKLYDEVKAGETIEHEYQEKVASLIKKDEQGSDIKSLEKLKAATNHLRMRYIVSMQSMDLTIAQIYGLRDEQLYPGLLQLLDGMATMWETMRHNHETQAGFVDALKSLDRFQPQEETSAYYRHRLTQLFIAVKEWYIQFCRLIDCQKDHIGALHNWLNVNLIPKDKVPSSPRGEYPPIHELVKAWIDAMDELPDEIARSAIRNFASVVLTIIQKDEKMKLREKCEATSKELDRKSRLYENWCVKNRLVGELDRTNPLKVAKEEREIFVITLKEQLEECQKMFKQEREKSLARFTHQLLDVLCTGI